MLQYTDINIPVNKVQQVGIPGRFVYYLAGSAGGLDQTIKIRSGNTGGSTLLKPGQSFRLADTDKSVDSFYVENYANAGTIIGTLLIGDGAFEDNRISGSVEVIDGGKARTLAGVAFSAWVSAPGVPGVRSLVQLQNPAGSGRNVTVERIAVASQVSTGFEIRPTLPDVGGGSGNAASKLVTGGALVTSNAIFKVGTRAVDTTPTLYLLNAAVGTQASWRPMEPIVIAPGGILSILGQALNSDVAASMEWYEEKI